MARNHIFCMKWAPAYGSKDVNILYAMVARNITGPKVALWSKELHGLEGIALFIDLDSVIVDNIDCYFEYGDPNDVITARNWLKKFRKSGQTPVFRFPIGDHSYMIENLRAAPAHHFPQIPVRAKLRHPQHPRQHQVLAGSVDQALPCPLPGRAAAALSAPAHPAQGSEDHQLSRPARTRGCHARPVDREIPDPSSRRTPAMGVFSYPFREKMKKHISRYVQRPDWVADHWRE